MNEHSSRSHAIFIITIESSEVIIKISFFFRKLKLYFMIIRLVLMEKHIFVLEN
jgi:hypothetical protein